MNRIHPVQSRLAQGLLVALLGAVAIAGCKKNEEPAATPPPAAEPAALPPVTTPAPMATASVTGIDLGNAVGADMRVATPMSTFATGDTIHASVATSTSDAMATVPASLGIKWTYLDSDPDQVVHEETRQVNLTGAGATDFQISKPDGWPTGRYKVEVSLDGAVVQSREFEVR